MRSPSRQTMRPRSCALIFGHGPESKARRAAATAASMSRSSALPTGVNGSSLAGLIGWYVSPAARACHLPATKISPAFIVWTSWGVSPSSALRSVRSGPASRPRARRGTSGRGPGSACPRPSAPCPSPGPDTAPTPPKPRDAPPEPWRPSITDMLTACDRERDLLRRHGQLGEPDAGGVLDRVGEGGRRRHDRRLADTAGAERSGRRRLLHDDGLDVRQVGGGELAIVEQARVHEPALVVIHQPLGQRHAEALHGPALHLALDAEGVDGFPDVLHDDEIVQRDLAG